jgi:putative oxygen-independent coproporphyrinogen III oxidase
MKTAKKIGLYIHIPFCKTICVYCAFPTFANKHDRVAEYLQALYKEIAQRSSHFSEYQVDTIYFGGGTPSLLNSEQFKNILKIIRSNFSVEPSVEIEIECNPESLEKNKIGSFKKLGVTRISVGIQSLNDKTLWKIARPHNTDTSIKALETLKQNNWKNFGCDLIIGLPYQTPESFKKDIREVLSFSPTHLSTYFLSYDTKRIDTFIKDSPSEEEQIKMYLWADKFLESKGYKHYEVSNFAKPGHESRHNLKYWNQEEYLGLGLGAHSFYDQTVWENSTDFDEYVKKPATAKNSLLLDKELFADDKIMLSLRQRKGLNLAHCNQLFGKTRTNVLLKDSIEFISSKHLHQSQNQLFCTNKGWLILNKITEKLCN